MSERVTFGVFALLAGILSALTLLLLPPPPALAPDELIAYVESHKRGYAMGATAILLWTIVSIPFVAGLGVQLGRARRILATAAMLLCSGGILLVGFAAFVSIGAFLAVAGAAASAPPQGAAFDAAVWRNLAFYMSDPGLMTWGLGQVLFALLAWNEAIVPRWLAVVGLVGGLAGLLTLAVFQTAALAILQVGAFAIWGIAIGVIVLRRRVLPTS